MKILHILDHSIPLHSGYTFRTAAILREQRRMGWETVHITSPKQKNGNALEETVDSLHFYRTPARLLKTPVLGEFQLMQQLTRRLLQVAQSVRPDILHAHSPVLNAYPAIWVGRRLGIPVVYEVRAFWEDAAVDHGTSREGGLRYRVSRALETLAFKYVGHVTTICDGLRQDIIQRGIPSEKITVIPNAVDPEKFTFGGNPDPELRRSLRLEGCRVLGFLGSFYGYEGLNLLLDAYPRIREHAADIRVLLVGGGIQENTLKAQAKRLGIDEQVIFTGRVPHDQIQRYYDLVDLLVYPRLSMRLTEVVTPLKPLEAMAQGRLLVASDVGGHKELIRHGQTGWLFKAGSADALAQTVLDILADPNSWDAVRHAGRQYIDIERKWEVSVAHYDEVYQRVTCDTAGSG